MAAKYLPDNPPRVQHTRKPPEDCEQDVDQKVGAAATLEKDTELDGMAWSGLKHRVAQVNAARVEAFQLLTYRRDEEGNEIVNHIPRGRYFLRHGC